MKIAMMVRSLFTTPVPKDIGYSPSTIAKTLAESLEELGHEISFYGPEGPELTVSHIETCGLYPTVSSQKQFDEYLHNPDLFQHYMLAGNDNIMVKAMLERANNGEYDCVVFHHFEGAMSLAGMYPNVPVIHILHDFMDDKRGEFIRRNSTPNQYLSPFQITNTLTRLILIIVQMCITASILRNSTSTQNQVIIYSSRDE
ncbi:hypothetical protein H7Y29_01675 [Microbacteriaceae bacterium]|nr:hypothetical protein [Candidatus Saccharibacteria bacterium]